ncbi:hypothetical protein ABZS66_43425 [Dactylosporangium sp. NPDC005572]|uniref:alpha/beta fold hydrolase n=1 Tax=Dactylosporangium sp. NPDC005572 TaxID=3156889 RepID=UPI0033B60D97
MPAGVTGLDVPVILVRGELSDVILPPDAERFLALGARTRHVEVPRARHMVASNENDVFLEQFLTALADTLPGFPARSA